MWAQDTCGDLSLVREDRDGRTSSVPVVPPGAALGSYVRKGEALKAYKREALPKMRYPFRLRADFRPLGDDQVDRPEVEVG